MLAATGYPDPVLKLRELLNTYLDPEKVAVILRAFEVALGVDGDLEGERCCTRSRRRRDGRVGDARRDPAARQRRQGDGPLDCRARGDVGVDLVIHAPLHIGLDGKGGHRGDIDKDVYFATKIHLADRMKNYPDIEKIGEKNGFVFYLRKAK